nr:hypothetical protein [uncultured Campylobacter sp.]
MRSETRFGFLNLIATCACFGIDGRELRHKFNARGIAVEILGGAASVCFPQDMHAANTMVKFRALLRLGFKFDRRLRLSCARHGRIV